MTDQFYYNIPAPMTLSKQGKAYIMGIEGAGSTPYLDDYPRGEWTIGFGITRFDGLDVKNLPRDQEMPIEEMVTQFLTRVKKYEDSVNRIITKPITQQEFDAFVSFQYNTGALAKSTAARLFNSGANKQDVVQALKLYNKDGGRVVQGLVRRRKEEGDIFLYGKYAGDGKTTIVRANSKGKQMWSTAKEISLWFYL